MEGWIKLHRKLLDWRWFNDGNTLKVFLYILLKSNHEKRYWKTEELMPGQMIFGRKKLSETLAITEQSLRTCLTTLKSTSTITIKTTNKYSVVTVVNWASYQSEATKSTSKLTNKLTNNQPTTNQQLTTLKEIKEDKELEEGNKPSPKKNTPSPDFDKFWDIYDYKKDREGCEKLWIKVSDDEKAVIFRTLPLFIKESPIKQFRKHPATYLRNKAWNDEIIPYQQFTKSNPQQPAKEKKYTNL